MRHVGEMEVGTTVRVKRLVAMRLDSDRGERLDRKEHGKVPNFA